MTIIAIDFHIVAIHEDERRTKSSRKSDEIDRRSRYARRSSAKIHRGNFDFRRCRNAIKSPMPNVTSIFCEDRRRVMLRYEINELRPVAQELIHSDTGKKSSFDSKNLYVR